MANYIGSIKEVDHYIGSNLVVAKYIGENKYFDAYTEVTGLLPIIFKSRATVALKNYRIYGSVSGAGVETENLFDKDNVTVGQALADGTYTTNTNYRYSDYIPCVPEQAYYFKDMNPSKVSIALQWFDEQKNFVSGVSYALFDNRNSFTINAPNNVYFVRFTMYKTAVDTAMLVEGSTAPTSYIPFGYQIPLTITSGQTSDDYPLYIGSTKLGEEEYLDYESGKVYKFTGNAFDKNDSSQMYQGYTFNVVSKKWFKYTGTAVCFRVPCAPRTRYRISAGTVVPTIRIGQLKTSEVSQVNGQGVEVSDVQALTDTNVGYVTTDADTLYILLQFPGISISDIVDALAVMPLTPTDPPVPFPAIQAYQGENMLSSTESVGNVTVKGRIREWQYRRVDYIKSNGNQYILTDIGGLNASTDYIEAEMSFGALSRLNDGTCLFGCATVVSGHWAAFGVLGDAYNADANIRNNRFQFFPNYSTGGSGTIKRMGCSTNGDYSSKLLLSLKTPQSTVVNTSTSTTYVPTILDPNIDATTLQPIDFTQLAKFCVFAGQYYRSENDIIYYRCGRETSCYSIRIYRNSTLIHSLIPVERKDGELGLLDEITEAFYTNAGTGTFEKGGYI